MRAITVSRNDLMEAMKTVSMAINTRDTCSNYCFEADSQLRVYAGDGLGLIIKRYVDAVIVNDNTDCIKFSLQGGTLRHVLKLIPDETVKIICHHSMIEIIHDAGNILLPISDSNVHKAFLKYLNEEDKDTEIRHTIEIPDMRKYLDKTAFCMADDNLRPVMNGVLFKWIGEKSGKDGVASAKTKLHVVSSDGHKLALLETDAYSDVPAHDVIIPSKTVNVLRRVLPKVGWLEIRWKKMGRRFRVVNGNGDVVMEIDTQIVGGRLYPNYMKVLPASIKLAVTVERKKLLAAVKRASFFTPASGLIKMELVKGGDSISLSAQDFDFAMSTNEEVPAEYGDLPESPFRIGLKDANIESVLAHLSSEYVTIGINDSRSGCTFSQEDTVGGDTRLTYLSMPMMYD